jgi:drug/metabolite transporter (DMT)-like permease
MYYGIVIISVLMFGVQFYLNDKYQKQNGTGAGSVFTFSFISAIVGVIALSIINGFDFSFTRFTLIWAFITALNSILCSICSLKALEKVNLSVYSLFSMLGGMLLPFIAGLFFYNEPMTVAKAVCVVLVVAALLITVSWKKTTGGEIYYIGVFILNGMSGVLSKIYGDASYPKVSSGGYSLWMAIMSVLISAIALIVIRKNLKKPNLKAILLSAGGGALNRIANFLLLIALAVLPASVQYPFVTGGVIIVSTVLAALTKQKPTKKEIIAVGLSFIGVLALVLIPI